MVKGEKETSLERGESGGRAPPSLSGSLPDPRIGANKQSSIYEAKTVNAIDSFSEGIP
jgi:hypothetical protein